METKLKFKLRKGRKLSRRMKRYGLDISIETDKGENRYWHDPHADDEKGVTKMKYPYGYIRRTMGADDEQVDVYVGPEEEVDEVYVIRQMKKPDFKEYDEDKVMMCFESAKQAKNAYLMHYNSDKFFGSMDTMTIDDFKEEFVNKALGPAVGMMMLQSFDNPDYIEHLLKQIAGMADAHVMNLYKEIWGDGYACQNADPGTIRDEMIGFLLDQRDHLNAKMNMMPPEMQQPSLDLGSSPSSISSPKSEGDPSEGQSLETEEPASMPSIDSFFSELLTNKESEPSEPTR